MAIKMGINTDNWRLENRPLQFCVKRTAELGVKWIEFNTLLGFDFIEGLGFSPAVSLDTDPYALRDLLAKHDLKCSCLDAHYPLWSYRCIDYMTKAIIFADQIGCDAIATTDSENFPPRYNNDEWMNVIEYHLHLVLEVAERHNIVVCVEPHGELTNDPGTLTQIIEQQDHPLLKVNFDTGNSFIRGHDPVEFLKAVVDKVHHLHIKDVSESLAAAIRGESTGIASSEVAIGEGVNAHAIRGCVALLKENNFDGVCSLECRGDALTAKSVKWFGELIAE